jgi:hypothetical protein
MKTAAIGLPARRWGLFALVALLGLSIAAGGTSAVASGPGHAIPAKKKKCKKAKKGAVSAKKKKCKRKPVPVVLPAPAPLVRATLSWPSGDVDMHAFDASGNQSGFVSGPDTIVQGIPDSVHSPDAQNGGSETFTDNIFVVGGPANREFSYAFCFFDSANATFTAVARDGTTLSQPVNGQALHGYAFTVTGGPPVPSSFSCPG